MVKKIVTAPRAAPRTAKADVVTRVPAETVSLRAYSFFQARGSEHGRCRDGAEDKIGSEERCDHHGAHHAPKAQPWG